MPTQFSPQIVSRNTLLAAVALLSVLHARAETEWTRFRGPNGSGIAADAQPPTAWSDTQNVQWKTTLPGGGTSSPIIVGERVFVTCYSGYGNGQRGGDISKLQRELVCVNRADGKVLWSSAVPAAQPEDDYNG